MTFKFCVREDMILYFKVSENINHDHYNIQINKQQTRKQLCVQFIFLLGCLGIGVDRALALVMRPNRDTE